MVRQTKQRRKISKAKRAKAKDGEPASKRTRLEGDATDADERPSTSLIKTLPFELVAEILLNSKSTRDVLAFARTCKHFCATLTRPIAAYVWKNARQNMLPRPLPEPLPGWSEHGYAAFVFGSPGKCEVCNADVQRGPYKSYALRLRLCPKKSCLETFNNTMLTEMPLSVPTSHYTTVSKALCSIESTNCALLNPSSDLLPTEYWPSTSLKRCFRSSDWATAVQGYLEATADPDSLARHLMMLNERAARILKYMEHCVEVHKWMSEYTAREKEVKVANETWAKDYAERVVKAEYWDLMNTECFGTMLRGMTRTLETTTDEVIEPIREKIQEEIQHFQDHRLRRKQEADYRIAREAIETYHERLKSTGTHDPLPPLEAFRKLDVVHAIQSHETEDAGVRLQDRVMTDLLKMNISRWRDDVRAGLAGILEMKVAVPKPGSKAKVTHPAERISARFRCSRCKGGGKEDHCLNFAGVCSHECKTNVSMPRAQRVAWKTWRIDLFVKDEKAMAVLSRLAKMLDIDEQQLDAAKAWNSVGPRIQCKSCTGIIVMKPEDVAGHCHRHEAMDFGILTEADAASMLKDRPLISGLAKKMLKLETQLPTTHAYVCRHCPVARPDDQHIFSVSGIRSHLQAKHGILGIRDEDVYQEPEP